MSEKGEGLALKPTNEIPGTTESNAASNTSNAASETSNNLNAASEASSVSNVSNVSSVASNELNLNNENHTSNTSSVAPSNNGTPNTTTEESINSTPNSTIEESREEISQEPPKENSGVKITSQVPEPDDDALYIGDKITINSTKYGKVTGHIYYLNENEMIRIMPLGLSSVLIDFPIIHGEFDPEIGILTDEEGNLDIARNKKGPRVGFVALRSFREGQTLEALTKSGEKVAEYTITEVTEDNDRIKVKNNETNDIQDIDFSFQGIPTDLPFSILRIAKAKELPKEEEEPEQAPKQEVVEESDEIEEFDLGTVTLLETIESQERIYPENTQKSDFLTDLLYDIPVASQKNPKIVRRIRALVELFSSLKNSVVKRKSDGSIEGEEKLSVITMNDLLRNYSVPIIRPVLETKRILVSETDLASENAEIIVNTLESIVVDSTDYLKRQGDIQGGNEGVGTPRWYQALLNFFRLYPFGDKYSEGDYIFSDDGDYFRQEIPGSANLNGLVILKDQFEDLKHFKKYQGNNLKDYIGKISQSLRRGHGPTYRPKTKGGTTHYIPADKANVKGYVLFPYRAVISGYMGAIRTGTLWDACVRGRTEPTSIATILEELGGISDVKDAQSILYLDSTSATGLSFSEYLKMILETIVISGFGDLASVKSDLGIQDMELNSEQYEIIQTRINSIIASFRTLIREKREAKPQTTSTFEPILENYAAVMKKVIESYPELGTILKHMESRLPGYKNIDIAVFSYIYSKTQDFFLACLSKNPTAIEIEKERFVQDSLLKILQDATAMSILERNKGAPPEPNPCEHTNALTIIRKITDSTDRIKALSKFIKIYQGGRKENWIECSVCNENLVCHHELLQIQQYLHPREHQAIQKEIILGYAGGTFGRNYICRNCGLPIAEMEFDTSIEYDDEGKPLMGRSQIVDQDAIDADDIEQLFGPTLEKQEEITFETSEKTKFYKIAHVLADRLRVDLSDERYRQLVDRADMIARDCIKAKSATKLTDPQYNQYVGYYSISIVSVLILLDIQCRIPNYVVRSSHPGCKAGFGGYPLYKDAKPESPDDSLGIHYIICVIMGFIPNFTDKVTKESWKYGFHKIANAENRKKEIEKYMLSSLKFILEKDSKIQQELDDKRKYLEKLLGAGAASIRPVEVIPSGFLPRMESVVELAENAAKAPSVPEGAKGTQGEELMANAWIRAAHSHAKETAQIIRGSTYAETACCSGKIQEPNAYWKVAALPSLPPVYTLKTPFSRQTILYTPFNPRELQPSIGEPSPENAYRVFLQVCWQGPRVGYAHELGYDNKCDWCDIVIPVNYLYPDIYLEDPTWRAKRIQEEKEKQDVIEQQLIQEIKVSFDTQNVPHSDPAGFQAILDAAHGRTQFNQYRSLPVKNPAEFLQEITKVEYEPIENYTAKLVEAMTNLAKNPNDPVSIANALKPLRDGLGEAEARLKEILDVKLYGVLLSILEQTPETTISIIRAYFLNPIQRISAQYDPEIKLELPTQYKKGTTEKLSEEHIKQLDKMLETHTAYLEYNNTVIVNSTIGYLKTNLYFVTQLSSMLQHASELRITRLKYDDKLTQEQLELLLKEILRITLLGPLWQLLNSEFVPETEDEIDLDNDADSFHTKIQEVIKLLIFKYVQEKTHYSPIEVRNELAKAREIEKLGFIAIFDKLSDEERQTELVKKRLKMGRWNIGKLAYKYDPDQWDKNREENLKNYGMLNGEEGPEENGPALDEEGYDVGENNDDE